MAHEVLEHSGLSTDDEFWSKVGGTVADLDEEDGVEEGNIFCARTQTHCESPNVTERRTDMLELRGVSHCSECM